MSSVALFTQKVAAQLPTATICPTAPGDAQQYVDDILGYVLWGVLIVFILGVLVGVGGLVAGRVIGMPHASKAAIGGLVTVFIAAIAYFILPAILNSIMGSGCVVTP